MNAEILRADGTPDFYLTVRHLESESGTLPVGQDHRPDREAVRFRGAPTFSFPHGGIAVAPRREGGPRDVSVHFMTFLGACGVLPQHYTELVAGRASRRDRAIGEFFDLLLHRSVSFFYRAHRKYRVPFAFEAAQHGRDVDQLGAILLGLVGLGTPGLASLPREGAGPWVHYASQFARTQRTARGLEAILTDVCGVDVRVVEFVGRWREVLDGERTALGSRHCTLGESCVMGGRAYDPQGGIRVEIGPMPMEEFHRFAPRTGQLAWLPDFVASFLDGAVDFEIVGKIVRETIAPIRLGESAGSTALGSGSWLASQHASRYDATVPIWLDKTPDPGEDLNPDFEVH